MAIRVYRMQDCSPETCIILASMPKVFVNVLSQSPVPEELALFRMGLLTGRYPGRDVFCRSDGPLLSHGKPWALSAGP